MRKPLVGDILAGITSTLRDSVLPALGDGAAQRQLKAALFSLGRLQRSWDRWPSYLSDDNADLRETLQTVLAAIATHPDARAAADELTLRLGVARAAGDSTRFPSLAALGESNDELQELACATDALVQHHKTAAPALFAPIGTQLEQLYQRMIDRELTAWASQSDAE